MINFHVKAHDLAPSGHRAYYVTTSLLTEDLILGSKQWVKDFPLVPAAEMGQLKMAELALIGFHECLAKYQRTLREKLREPERAAPGKFGHSETDPSTGREGP